MSVWIMSIVMHDIYLQILYLKNIYLIIRQLCYNIIDSKTSKIIEIFVPGDKTMNQRYFLLLSWDLLFTITKMKLKYVCSYVFEFILPRVKLNVFHEICSFTINSDKVCLCRTRWVHPSVRYMHIQSWLAKFLECLIS